ncbi:MULTISPECIES: GNAT family N-acetyltransferase [unclassified Exiguobacterium]|uniref:GNAT family N-acetyltransferase n=1 Tax=unclassified Exiguobacterium TaxID=2644629 RepID=UPI00103C6C07|nr:MULTISPECIES: GNAT family protein [unclassified Exiguobacterium]TCI69145.1 N-acetyltransferase [Exiguobacterium sp. IPCI3]TCI78604.1 N-acetyltransferase [Exiguobacterium sp. IPCH1]TCI81108.1 N-acetyltransferase [Exiguobacterium sp. IPBC4]
MDRVNVKALRLQDEALLYAFECANRIHFERSVPSRGDAYYEPESFHQALQQLLSEQADGDGCYYLMWYDDTIVGRLNVHHTDTDTGEVGYRVGAEHGGRGYATAALRQLLTFELPGFNRLRAETTSDNVASQHVLRGAGFIRDGEARQLEWEGRTLTFYTYVYPLDR